MQSEAIRDETIRRRVGTPFTLAEWRATRRLVRGSRTILYDSLVGTVKESYLLQLSVALYTFGSRSAGGVGQY